MIRKSPLALLFVMGLALAGTLWPTPADAQWRRGRVVVVGGPFYDPFFYDPFLFYDPFFGPWFPYQYPYPPYGYYRRFAGPEADLRVMVTPKQAQVYVDGYYAGIVDDFDGFFQRLHVPPGEREITLHLDGYRTVTQKLYLTANSTYKLRYTMQKLPPGEVSEPPPSPPAPQPGAAPEPPRMMRPGTPGMPPPMRRQPPPPPPGEPQPQPMPPAQASNFGTLVIRVQPAGADILIDGERWMGPQGDERLLVQVGEGPHRVEVRKNGYRQFSTEVQARRGETTPLNVSLSPERQ